MTFSEWMKLNGLGDPVVAQLLGIDRSMVFRLRNGQRTPSAGLMRSIAEASEGAVMPNDWLDLDGAAVQLPCRPEETPANPEPER